MDKTRENWFNTKRILVLTGTGVLILVCAAGIVLLAKRFQASPLTPDNSAPITLNTNLNTPSAEDENKYGIEVALSNGQAQPQIIEAMPFATGEPLSPEEIEQLLARLPDLPLSPDGQTEFNLPPDVLPPPRPGNIIQETFPPLETAPTPGTVESGPLQVVRFAPEGDIPLAPFVSITFNQPMVPVGTIKDLAAQDVPVIMEPALPGVWRWLGTKTLVFEYDSALFDRLPQATEYRVSVPAGTWRYIG